MRLERKVVCAQDGMSQDFREGLQVPEQFL